MATILEEKDITALNAAIKLLLVAQLKTVLKAAGQQISGIKSELQVRLIAHINGLYNDGEHAAVIEIREEVAVFTEVKTSTPTPKKPNTPSSSMTVQNGSPSYQSRLPFQSTAPHAMTNYTTAARVRFPESPFHSVVQPLTPVANYQQRREPFELSVVLDAATVDDLKTNENSRVLLYSAADIGLNMYAASEVAFPPGVELRVNEDPIKANLRGLKNKPGTTRPVDITSSLRLIGGYKNRLTLGVFPELKGMPNPRRYFLLVQLVGKKPIKDLVESIKKGKSISKQQTLKEMKSKAEDPDIVATSMIMSLKCPLSYARIEVPARSVNCRHNQCFDASSYIMLQEQAPQWTCPICTSPAGMALLVFDEYVDEILRSTSPDIDQVTIEPTGQWSTTAQPEAANGPDTPDTDDDDIVEIIEPDVKPTLSAIFPIPGLSLTQTPPVSSREESVTSSARRAGKRPAAEVIDLTLSDDEEPVPVAKHPRLSLRGGGVEPLPEWAQWSFTFPPDHNPDTGPLGLSEDGQDF